jgi:hypothetical protein
MFRYRYLALVVLLLPLFGCGTGYSNERDDKVQPLTKAELTSVKQSLVHEESAEVLDKKMQPSRLDSKKGFMNVSFGSDIREAPGSPVPAQAGMALGNHFMVDNSYDRHKLRIGNIPVNKVEYWVQQQKVISVKAVFGMDNAMLLLPLLEGLYGKPVIVPDVDPETESYMDYYIWKGQNVKCTLFVNRGLTREMKGLESSLEYTDLALADWAIKDIDRQSHESDLMMKKAIEDVL